VLGLTFKENCSDIRNSKVVDIVRELGEFGVEVLVHDPHADADAALRDYGIRLCAWEQLPAADGLILAVPHREYLALQPAEFLRRIVRHGCLIDIKSALDPQPFCHDGVSVWRL
jgi:UDP-N-acetyl-D-galactosamine dehydrogenase